MNYSVIIPTFNVSEFILETIDSVLNQTQKGFEIVIVDDGSEDDTCLLIERLNDPRINLIKLDHTGNIGKNMNYGILNSKYDLICILGADDLWESDKIEIQMNYLDKYNFVCSNGSIISKSGDITQEKYIGNFEGDKDLSTCDLLENNYVIASSIAGFKDKFIQYGNFDEKDGRKAEDYILWLNVTDNEKIKFINRNLIKYRVHGNNISFRNSTNRISMLIKTYNIRKVYFDNSTEENIRICAQNGMASLLNELYKICYMNKMFYRSRVFLSKRISLQTDKFSVEYFKLLVKLTIINIKYYLRRIKS